MSVSFASLEPRHEKFLHMRKQRRRSAYREADLRLCFRCIDITIPLLPYTKFKASSHLHWLLSPVCVGPGWKPRRPVFSQRGSLERCLEVTDYEQFDAENVLPKSMDDFLHFFFENHEAMAFL